MDIQLKALEWTQTGNRLRGSFLRQTWEAGTPFGPYTIYSFEDYGSDFGLRLPCDNAVRPENTFPSLEAAQVAAEAHYEKGVRECIKAAS